MDFKKIVLLVGALMVAAVTAVMAKNMFAGAGAQQASARPVPQGPKVLVARKALPVGTIIDASMIGFETWPADAVQPTYYQQGQPDSDQAKLLGTVVRYPIAAGQPLARGALVSAQDRGFLAAALGPGMRAVTVPVTSSSGIAGFVFPGDRVDLVLTQEVDGSGEGEPLRVSETIVRNIRVLATDQRYTDKDEDGKPVVKEARNVTLEVTPTIAEKIAVSQSIGKLSLSLRSIADQSSEIQRALASGDVKIPEGTSPAQERQMLKSWASRPIDTNTTYTTGGDVSRFQRRTVPTSAPASAAAPAGSSNGAAPSASPIASGPVVRVARGNAVTVVPVGAH
ncbi:MAG TPA: Flp pilus assembly protein CpaB [Sphingomicrobium sp.]|jgi:pilus assembly protein CpaB|nr:Flp pilus assembly protein CpaB [Sphingomicrobium sp.]